MRDVSISMLLTYRPAPPKNHGICANLVGRPVGGCGVRTPELPMPTAAPGIPAAVNTAGFPR